MGMRFRIYDADLFHSVTLILLVAFSVSLAACTTVAPQRQVKDTSFSSQKGKLAWPSEGTVAEPYGEVINPVYGTKSMNPGILIATTEAAGVQSVFEGKVTAIYPIPEFGQVITISHGEFTTVYGNLSSLFVSEGMYVSAGQLIGAAGTKDEPRGEAVFFALFEDNVELNPEVWLAKR